jgi:hypothetical protein
MSSSLSGEKEDEEEDEPSSASCGKGQGRSSMPVQAEHATSLSQVKVDAVETDSMPAEVAGESDAEEASEAHVVDGLLETEPSVAAGLLLLCRRGHARLFIRPFLSPPVVAAHASTATGLSTFLVEPLEPFRARRVTPFLRRRAGAPSLRKELVELVEDLVS